jgi:uncharacterized protein
MAETAFHCPICQRPVPAGAATAPFCSPRCRQVDLVRWTDGKYAIQRELTAPDLEEFPEDDLVRGGEGIHDVG